MRADADAEAAGAGGTRYGACWRGRRPCWAGPSTPARPGLPPPGRPRCCPPGLVRARGQWQGPGQMLPSFRVPSPPPQAQPRRGRSRGAPGSLCACPSDRRLRGSHSGSAGHVGSFRAGKATWRRSSHALRRALPAGARAPCGRGGRGGPCGRTGPAQRPQRGRAEDQIADLEAPNMGVEKGSLSTDTVCLKDRSFAPPSQLSGQASTYEPGAPGSVPTRAHAELWAGSPVQAASQ